MVRPSSSAAPAERPGAGRCFLAISLLGVLFTLGAASAANSAASARASEGGTTGCGWPITASPNISVYNELNSISGVSVSDIWAVGSSGPGNFSENTLVEHWDGASWTIVPSPDGGDSENSLYGVAAVASNDAWAVGYKNGPTGNTTLSMILHWNGSNWSEVASPSPGTWVNELYGVVAVSANDVWAIGTTRAIGSSYRTLVVHWDGTAWSRVDSPSTGAWENRLKSIAAVSANDLWAVGTYQLDSGGTKTLIERWNGTQWSVVPSPNIEPLNNFLYGVSASASGNVWAVGYTCPTISGCFSLYDRRSLAMHWDGTQWNLMPLPDLASQDDALFTTLAISPNDVWAMGSVKYNDDGQPLAMHWDGAQWSQVPSEDPGSVAPEYRAMLRLAGGEIWAVGAYHFGGNPVFRTLTSLYGGPCGTVTPTSTRPTSTPTATQPVASPTGIVTSTATGTAAPTNPPAPTSTPTVCAVAFSDVHSSDYFYNGVTYLACAGAISGYSDGTFRPFNDTTRGQLSKIVVLAKGWSIDTTGGPHFSDVQAGSTFYSYVETAYNHGIISGYADGTFRPNANVTRGQLSKIVVSAEQWPIDLSGAPHFTDVQEGSAFYPYVETIFNHGLISGYADNTFRPGNNAIRAQIAKIAYGARTAP